jgi:hypothetical protein
MLTKTIFPLLSCLFFRAPGRAARKGVNLSRVEAGSKSLRTGQFLPDPGEGLPLDTEVGSQIGQGNPVEQIGVRLDELEVTGFSVVKKKGLYAGLLYFQYFLGNQPPVSFEVGEAFVPLLDMLVTQRE